MAGMRALSVEEQNRLLAAAKCRRDRLLIILLVCTGFRATEALGLRVRDVSCNGVVVDQITVPRRRLKNGRSVHRRSIKSRRVAVHAVLRTELRLFLRDLAERGELRPDKFLFSSRESAGRTPMVYCRALQIFKETAAAAGVYGRIGTHSGRKTFAKSAYDKSGHNLLVTQNALGHASVSSTIQYLDVSEEEVSLTILAADVGGGAPTLPAEIAPAASVAPPPAPNEAGPATSLAS